ncbi:putative helicase mov-10-B.1 [Sycon ciliatum]|uniref:putative helicase mov-10-B.1 n=1 Tax=Sycon ciliatum TaxID=27933 RepID=UPI0020A9979E|eukprot:scpid10282/ scgid14981/ Putative helicase mov-10-B.1
MAASVAASTEGSHRLRRPYGVRRRELEDCVKTAVEHLPEFLFYINGQTEGLILKQQYLLRDDVRRYWPQFASDRAITVCDGVRLSPSRVCYAIIRTYSPNGARPRAQVQNRDVIHLGERALDVMEIGYDRRKDLLQANVDIKSRSEDLISDKWGVTVTADRECSEGNISLDAVSMSTAAQDCPTLKLTITNSSLSKLTLESCYLLFEHHGFAMERLHSTVRYPMSLSSSTKHTISVRCVIDQLGIRRDWCVFELKTASGEKFNIVRFLSVYFTDSVTSDPAMQATRPFRAKPVKLLKTTDEDIVDGEKPEEPIQNQLIVTVSPLVAYNEHTIKKHLHSQLFVEKHNRTGRDVRMKLNLDQKRLLDQRLTADNYKQKMLLMLLLEHRQEEVDIHNYDMPHAVMTVSNMYLALKVPGLAENRPSLLRNDHLLARTVNGKQRHRGYVHRVELEEVMLRFNKDFHRSFIANKVCEIEFCINPNPWWLKNRAVCLSHAALDTGVLFPDNDCLEQCDVPVISRFYDRHINNESNPEQCQAVQQIVAGSSGRAPYLIFGPPGTGKTTTLVEAIKQVRFFHKKCRILACTPSNSAADLVTTRLLKHIDAKDIIRLNALSRKKSSLADGVMNVSYCDGDLFYFPNLARIRTFSIVVCTLATSGRLVSAGMPRDHFTHVFIDECGHAVEAECIVPLSSLVEPGTTQVVLTGDPYQLGPIVRSSHAAKHGLTTSLLERLMKECDLYQRHIVDGKAMLEPRAVTKLLRNYRSHPAIIEVPNECFYDNELQVFADKFGREMLCDWEHLPADAKKSRFPIIFNGVEGIDEREGDSPSFFNLTEVSRVLFYVEQLRRSRRPQISASQIGVISPYHKQVLRIRKQLRAKGHESVKVGSVEEFQGQERTVIIISTVRSQPKYLTMDKTFSLGFLQNQKRFNVAITRAMALLIVIGNPYILNKDDHWKMFLNFVIDNGGYTGCKYSPDQEAVLREKMENLSLNSGAASAAIAAAAAEEGIELDQREDPGWRREE